MHFDASQGHLKKKDKSYVCICATMQYFRFTVLCQQRHLTYGSIHSTALHLCHYTLQNPREVEAFFFFFFF